MDIYEESFRKWLRRKLSDRDSVTAERMFDATLDHLRRGDKNKYNRAVKALRARSTVDDLQKRAIEIARNAYAGMPDDFDTQKAIAALSYEIESALRDATVELHHLVSRWRREANNCDWMQEGTLKECADDLSAVIGELGVNSDATKGVP